ncbi:MAG TPA: hypothetical protein VGM30_10595 [Puia sp.]|jgi:hypothetical protein
MTNALLDEILRQLNNDWGINTEIAGPDFFKSLPNEDQVTMDLIRYLEQTGYIKVRHTSGAFGDHGIAAWYISLTPEGAKFIMNGGYTHETYLREEPIRMSKLANDLSEQSLQAAKQSLKRASIAIWISALAFLAGIVIFIIQTYHH